MADIVDMSLGIMFPPRVITELDDSHREPDPGRTLLWPGGISLAQVVGGDDVPLAI